MNLSFHDLLPETPKPTLEYVIRMMKGLYYFLAERCQWLRLDNFKSYKYETWKE